MEKLKDIFYEKNDIIIALALVLIAGFIIANRVNAIMSYPEVLAAETQKQQEEQQANDKIKEPATTDSAVSEPKPAPVTDPKPKKPTAPKNTEPTKPPVTGEWKTAKALTVKIPEGSFGAEIATILTDAGAVPSKADFNSAVVAAKADTKLKAGTFQIPAGSTLPQVISIITK